MKLSQVFMILPTLLLAFGGVPASSEERQRVIMPNQRFAPDAITAQKIAEAVFAPVYGMEAVASEQPLRVTLKNNTWMVVGSVPCEAAPLRAPCLTALPRFTSTREMAKSFISHGQ